MVYVRLFVAAVCLSALFTARAGAWPIPNSNPLEETLASCTAVPDSDQELSASEQPGDFDGVLDGGQTETAQSTAAGSSTGQSASGQNGSAHPMPDPNAPVDANGNPIPLERVQPQRILGFMPNFRSVSGGAKPHPPGWKYNFTVATEQATDYSSFIFLGLTSLIAEGLDEHTDLGHGASGFYAYTWRGFLDKTDNTYLSAWLLASSLHEDTRYYALGNEHSIAIRALYVISRQAVAKTYGGRQTPNIAGLGGKVLAQVVSREYYPKSATTFPALAEKFSFSVMRDVIFTSIREFYPDAAAHFIRKHREKMAAKAAARDAAAR